MFRSRRFAININKISLPAIAEPQSGGRIPVDKARGVTAVVVPHEPGNASLPPPSKKKAVAGGREDFKPSKTIAFSVELLQPAIKRFYNLVKLSPPPV